MNRHIQNILDIIQKNGKLNEDEKNSLLKSLKDADKEFEITAFKLERTEKVKRTTAILLEETIEELEQKRKAIEKQNSELEIEACLERVRTTAMAMKEPADMLEVCRVISQQLEILNVKDIRNVQTAVFYKSKGIYLNYEYYRLYNKNFITEVEYNLQPDVAAFVNQMLKDPEAFFAKSFSGSEIKEWIAYQEKANQFVDPKLNEAESLHYYFYSVGPGALGLSTYNIQLNETELNILKRFRNVFELAYRRFIDIELAIAQAREAKIEAALEKVRAVAMGMTKPDDLLSICETQFTELQKLGFNEIRNAIIHVFNDEEGFFQDYDYSDFSGGSISKIFYNSHYVVDNFLKQIKGTKDAFAQIVIEGDQLNDWKEFRRKSGQQDDPRLENVNELYYYFYSIGAGNIGISNFKPITEEQLEILKRFRNVFNLSYQRYIDIALAEAQAREAQIEASLERVRSSAMAMHNSNDISSTTTVVFEELRRLNIQSKRCGVALLSENSYTGHVYAAATSSEGKLQTLRRSIEMTQHKSLKHQYESWKKQENYFIEMTGEELKSYYQLPFFYSSPDYVPPVNYEKTEYGYYIPFSEGLFYAWSENPYTENEIDILKRFKRIVDLTFRRFFDLQKAEAQAKEAQVEAALERVRSRTMAMQQSSDLHEVIKVVTDQLSGLGIKFNVANFAKIHSEGSWDLWISTPEQSYPALVHVPYLDHKLFNSLMEIISKGVDFLSDVYDQEEKNIFFKHFFENTLAKNTPEERKQYVMSCKGLARSVFLTKNIWLSVSNYTGVPFSDEENEIFKRFAKVFEQTYTRFLDLQKAEEQTREAKIEAALERVRSKAMAMNSSEDFVATISAFYHELSSLSHTPRRCGVGLIDKESRITELSTLNTTDKGDSIEVIGRIKLEGHPVLRAIYDNWLLQKEYHPVLKGNEIKEYYSLLRPQISIPDYSSDQVQYGYFFYFNEGGVYTWTEKELSEEELQIYRRFTSVLSLTHRRYLDIKEAEIRAVEAERQASLDRVRAEIASMRTAEDLNHITPVIWRELKTLKVPFFRCGVFIVDEQNDKVQVYLSTPDGRSLGVLNLSTDSNDLTSSTVDRWRKKQIYKEHWNKEEFISWTRSMMELGQVQNADTYQGSAAPPESLYLHLVPFTQGMIYVGDVSPLTDEKLELVKTLAEAFSIAYARYEDFKNLEEAKNKIEITLKDLKSAQAQLIHSEKMASLGELTAGIAHEIKNPLNFVNNFSDLSRELIDEVKKELQNNNNEEVLAILEDLKQNLEKINQHGKRADSIVKGMLLHSRGSSGEKVLTNINDLLDQDVTLAYHGMRAQNKEFNITIEKNYDETLEKIKVVPQDISRVFLNIINNACYAANEKKKESRNNFAPVLKVSTKNLNGKVEIRIKDNGKGIPADFLDKIFQPFFTTKPTGEGTGLGLSLSYDIVTKVHEGELRVETIEGEGTEFIIILNN